MVPGVPERSLRGIWAPAVTAPAAAVWWSRRIRATLGRRSGAADAAVPRALCLLSAGGFWLTKFTARATHDRAYELAEMLGLPPHVVDRRLGVLPYLHEAEAGRDFSTET